MAPEVALRDAFAFVAIVSALVVGLVALNRWYTNWRYQKRMSCPTIVPALQQRLAEVAAELRRLESDKGYARAHHIQAAHAAYDAILAEACRVMGVREHAPAFTDLPRFQMTTMTPHFATANATELPDVTTVPAEWSGLREDTYEPRPLTRFEMELALSERGWSW